MKFGILVLGVGAISLSGFLINPGWGDSSKMYVSPQATGDTSNPLHANLPNGLRPTPSGQEGAGDAILPMGNIAAVSRVIPCNSVNPFVSSAMACQESARSSAEDSAFKKRTNPLENVNRVTEFVMQGTDDQIHSYLSMRQYCEDSTAPDEEDACRKVAAAASGFEGRLKGNAQSGDATAQKLLGVELVREVYAARNSAAAEISANSTGAAVGVRSQRLDLESKWSSALDLLRQAAIKDDEAKWLLEQFTTAQ